MGYIFEVCKTILKKIVAEKKDHDGIDRMKYDIGYMVPNWVKVPNTIVEVHGEMKERSVVHTSPKKEGIRIIP
jgi:hypothetical protein